MQMQLAPASAFNTESASWLRDALCCRGDLKFNSCLETISENSELCLSTEPRTAERSFANRRDALSGSSCLAGSQPQHLAEDCSDVSGESPKSFDAAEALLPLDAMGSDDNLDPRLPVKPKDAQAKYLQSTARHVRKIRTASNSFR